MKTNPLRRLKDPKYKNGDFQEVWGWLRIGEIVDLRRSPHPVGNRPHCHDAWSGENVLYIGADSLGLDEFDGVPGAGVLNTLKPLTAPGAPASQWWFDRSLFSQHRQEHVGDSRRDPEVGTIAKTLLRDLVSRRG